MMSPDETATPAVFVKPFSVENQISPFGQTKSASTPTAKQKAHHPRRTFRRVDSSAPTNSLPFEQSGRHSTKCPRDAASPLHCAEYLSKSKNKSHRSPPGAAHPAPHPDRPR